MRSPLTTAIHVVLAGSLFAATASHADQASGFTIVPSVGYYMFDSDMELENDYYGSLGLGYTFSSHWGFELTYQMGSAESEISSTEFDLEQIRLDALYHFSSDGNVQPFLLIGGGNERWEWNNMETENSIVNAGVGLKVWFSDWASLRTDMRIINDVDNELTSYAVGLGLNFLLGGSNATSETKAAVPADADSDGVVDSQDRCPDTAMGTDVDMYGCEMLLDDDQDGVANSVDTCPDTSFGAKVDASGCYVMISETKEISMHVVFELNSFKITQESYAEIESVARFMREYPLTDVNIEGHTDDSGSAAYNQKLSQKRADAVAEVLINEYNIESSRVSATGYGESRPLVENNSSENRNRNRRVTAKITAQVERVQQ